MEAIRKIVNDEFHFRCDKQDMRISYFFCIFTSVLLFISCSAKSPQFVKKQEIVYQTGFPVRDPYGIFYNQENKTEYFYIADMMEYRKLLFFTIDGKKAMEIPTDSLATWRTTTGIAIKNLDTIIFIMSDIGRGNDRIVFMDRNGNRWKKIELYDAIQADENNWKYFFLGKWKVFFEQDELFLRILLVDKTVDSSILKTRNQELILSDIIPKTHQAHALLKYNIQTGQYQYALSDMWRIICPDTNLYLFSILFAIENNILFVYSATGNIVYLFDKDSFRIKKKIEITSPYADIGVLPCSLEGRIGWYFQNNIPLHGGLIDIMYDKYKHFYYVIIRHVPKDLMLLDEAPFSIQVYDAKFNKLTEQVFNGEKYALRDCLVCSRGLLIMHSSSREDDNPTEVKYDLFKVKKK